MAYAPLNNDVVLRPNQYPDIGKDFVITDGTSLLGVDDKLAMVEGLTLDNQNLYQLYCKIPKVIPSTTDIFPLAQEYVIKGLKAG